MIREKFYINVQEQVKKEYPKISLSHWNEQGWCAILSEIYEENTSFMEECEGETDVDEGVLSLMWEKMIMDAAYSYYVYQYKADADDMIWEKED